LEIDNQKELINNCLQNLNENGIIIIRDADASKVEKHKYCDSVKEYCKKFPLYNLEQSDFDTLEISFLEVNAKAHIASITSNSKLQNVLGASNSLYAGEGDKSPFYMHALIVNSYIESSYRCVDGGSQIARILTKYIFQNGGKILKHAEVKKMEMEGERLSHVTLADGREIKGERFISNIHPANMLDMLDTDRIRNAYRNRITGLENTVSVFIVNIVFKKHTFKFELQLLSLRTRPGVGHSRLYFRKLARRVWFILICQFEI